MSADIERYNEALSGDDQAVCNLLKKIIDSSLSATESKIWHAHPVWFIERNPIVGYSKLKDGTKLMFWSGADFDESELTPGSGKFKDASITYTNTDQIDEAKLKRWLKKAETIQWDYKNIVKRKGKLVRIV